MCVCIYICCQFNWLPPTAQQAAASAKSQRTTSAVAASTTRNGGSGATARGTPGIVSAVVPRHQRAALGSSGHTTMTTGTTTVSTVSGNQQIVGGVSGQPAQSQGFSRNPLMCALCNNIFQNPCLLACYHTFCAGCLRGRISKDGKLACPLCG